MKAVILKGIPASGKTTKAKEYIDLGYEWVNMDQIRLDNPDLKEPDVKHYQHQLISQAWSMGKNVVIDNTHMNPESLEKIKSFCKSFGYEVEVVDVFRDLWFNMPCRDALKVCLDRNESREKKVPASVIYEMYFKGGYLGSPAIDAVVCDLDGTLYDIKHRQKYLEGERSQRRWDKFESEEEIEKDMIVNPVKEVVNALYNSGKTVILVSGRKNTMCDITMKNLKRDGVKFHSLLMRQSWDSRKDFAVKKDLLEVIRRIHRVDFVIDDRPQVIDMWRKEGIFVFNVGDGKEF